MLCFRNSSPTLLLKTATLSASLFLFVFTNLTFAQEETSEIMLAEPVLSETEVILADPEVVSELDKVESLPESTENTSVESVQSPSEESLLAPEIQSLGAQISGSQDLVKKTVDTRFYSEPDPVTGSLLYKYPITVPPGRNMLQPDVNLLYSSQPDDEVGIVGFGWEFDIPYIQRINKLGTNNLYTQNYFYSSVDGELRSTSSVNYSAKTDSGAFNRYVFSTSTSKWVMTDKFGTKYTFGSSSSTRQDNPGNSAQIFKWMLEEVRDTNNNYIKYEYTKNLGQIYPSRIVYTGNGVTDGNFEILFNKSTKSAIATSSATGFLVVANQQITGITVKIAGINTMTYAIAYTPGDNGVRSLLERVTVSATSTEGVLSTLQPTKFSYKKSTDTKNWTEDLSKTIPIWFDSSTYLSDINGDGLVDILYSNQATASNTVYISNPTTWTYSSSWVPPVYFSNNGSDLGVRLVDVNGDGLVDVVQSFTGATSSVYLNNGSNWTASTSWSVPVRIASSTVDDLGIRFLDINGDSLTDIVRSSAGSSTVYVNSGLGWQASTTWTVPVDFVSSTGADNYVRLEDANGDGLPDLLQSYSTNGSVTQNRIYINSGSGWLLDTRWTIPVSFGDVQTTESGVRLADVNGDGLVDIVQSYLNVQTYVATYINSGSGWVIDELWNAPEAFINGTTDYAIRLADVNGDGLMDMMRSYSSESIKKVYANNNRPVDILTTVTFPEGGKSRFEYKAAQEYKQGSVLLNNRLPYAVNTLSAVSLDNGQGIIGSTTYQYIDGLYHFTNALDRQFAGFKSIVKTEPSGSVTKTFYHQGDTSSTTLGEYQDVAAKIGLAYRIELYDKNSNLNSKSIYKWDHSVTGSSTFLKLVQQTSLTYEGDSSHRDKAVSFTYNDTNGNISTVKNWGEVTANNDGSFADIDQDLSISTTTYAASSSAYVVALPASIVTSDQTGQKISEQKMYYDNQSLNGVLSGNITKKEQWINSTTTASSTSVYNLYGLPTSQKDALGNTTSYSYEPFNLYVSTTTDALNYKTLSTYNYLTGKLATSTDQNGVTVATTYDGFGRPLKIKIPDINSSSTPLITKTQFQYFDTTQPSVKITSYLNTATNTESYIYSDGLGRTIQKRVEAEQSGDFVVNNYKYNSLGLLSAESLPYFDNGSNLSSQSINNKLYTYYDYDSLGRVAAVGTAVGTTTTSYTDWGTETTDTNGNKKGYQYDVFGNLTQVAEYNGMSTYLTTYTYNPNNNLIKITDALGNIRNFYYDAIGRQIKAEDLHAISDTTFGEWNYVYDLNGNKVTVVDPKLQVINYTYDALNRVLTENYTGTAGTEKTYTYDSCTKGIGRLCTASTPSATTTYTYNNLGGIQSETKTISNTSYQTQFTYNWLGDTTEITYPDSSQVLYVYNSAGLLERVLHKEVGTTSVKVIVSDFNYAPTGQVSYQKNGNQTETFNTFDKDNLYRLIEKKTIGPGLGIEEIQSLSRMMMGNGENLNEYLSASNDNPVELKVLSTSNSKTFLLGKNKRGDQMYSARVYTKPVYEVGVDGQFANEVGSKVQQDKAGWNITNQKFATYISNSSSDLYTVTTSNGVIVVSIADTKHKEWVSVLQKAVEQNESVFEIKEVLGKTADIELQVSGTQIKKDVVLREKPVFTDSDSDYRVTFKIVATTTLDLVLGTKKLSQEKVIVSSDEVILVSSLGTIGYIFPPVSYDSSDNVNPYKVIPIALTYELKSDGIYVTKIIPRKWLENAIYPVRADFVISTQSGVGDGHVLSQLWLSNWATQQSSSVGRLPNYTNLDFTVESSARVSNEIIIKRGFVPIDTSFLPDNAVISSSTLYLYVKSKNDQYNDAYGVINVYQGLQSSPTSIISSDYSKCGNTITNPTKGSTDFDITNIATSSFIGLTLNASGRSWASTTGFTKLCIREGHDAANQALTTNGTWQSSGVVIAASESAGTTSDPYLEIVYTVPNTAPSVPTNLLTEAASNPVGVTTLTPRFSAKFNDGDQFDSAVSYQIQVSANSLFTDLRWDSGKTSFSSGVAVDSFTPDIQYAGYELDRDSTAYYWRIKLWDSSDTASVWSVSTSTFTMSNDGKLLQKLNYSYDSVGNITKIIDSANGSKLLTTSYVYDKLYRLISATATSSAGTPTSTPVYKTALSIYSTSTLSDFPVYVNLANLSSSFWSNVKGDGGDVRVTDKLGNLLPVDLVSFSTSTQTGELYFKPSSIVGGTTTVFYILHGISSWQLLTDDDVLGSFAVWSGHRGRWQQVGATQSTNKRSNSVGNNGVLTEVNTPTATSDNAGRGNGSYGFNGSSQHLTSPYHSSFDVGSNFTLAVQFKAVSGSGSTDRTLFSRLNGSIEPLGMSLENGGHPFVRVQNAYLSNQNTSYADVVYQSTDLDDGAWHRGVFTYDNSTLRLYVDGNLTAIKSAPGMTANTPMQISLARWNNSGNYFSGDIDEISLTTNVATSSWVKAEYTNRFNPTQFYTVGSTTIGTATTTATTSTVTTQSYSYSPIGNLLSRSDVGTYSYGGQVNTPIYDDSLQVGWDNWSYGGTYDLISTSPVNMGTYALKSSYTSQYAGLQLRNGTLNTTNYNTLDFKIYIESGSNINLKVKALNKDTSAELGQVQIHNYLPGGTYATGTWHTVSIPLSALNFQNFVGNGAFIFQSDGAATVVVSYDQISLSGTSGGVGYTNPHAPTSVNGVTMTYDTNGNLTEASTTRNTWNYLNHLTQSSTGLSTSTYLYDYTGARTSMTVGTTTTRYPSKLYTHTGTSTDRDIYANGILIASIGNSTGTTTTYIHPDHLGSTNVVSNASGTAIQNITYNPYGDVRNNVSTAGISQSRQYIGEEYDGATKLSYLNARYYNANQGQFVSQDPVFWAKQNLENPQSMNSYSYAENNPINRKDPSGLVAKNVNELKAEVVLYQKQLIELLKQKIRSLGGSVKTFGGSAVKAAIDPVGGVQNATNKSSSASSRAGSVVGTAAAIGSFAIPYYGEVRGAQLLSRAQQVNGVLDPIAQSRRTAAVLRTTSGDIIVAGGGRDLTRAQIQTLMVGERAAAAIPGAHAEVTAITEALTAQSTPQMIAASRPICPSCKAYIESTGGSIVDAFTAIWK